MKLYLWNEDKNEYLKSVRGVSFEDVVTCLNEGRVLARIDHPNQRRYPGQKIFVVELNDYVYLVPFVENQDYVFLKTVFPSRKYTKIYLEEKGAK